MASGGAELAGIDTKIMAFVGTNDSADLITRLAKFSDKIYAAVSANYGQSTFPGGNITIISSHLDDAGIQRWIDRTGIGLIIDGIAEEAAGECELVRKKAEENGIEYLRIADQLRLSKNIRTCRRREDLISELSYTIGNILVEGADLYLALKEAGVDPDRMIVMTEPDPEELSRLLEAGCTKEQMISFGMIVDHKLMLSVLDELSIRFYILKGGKNRGIAEKVRALNHSDAAALIDGGLADQEGLTTRELWKLLSKRFGLRD